MIEGCIVAKLVLGYLKGEGLYRTCSAFQDECSLFHADNKELDNVFLTADLKTILDDYSQLREAGRENGVPSSTAVLKSLWKDLDVVIGQLKYATIPSSTLKASMGSQSTRTRRLNYGRARSMLPKTQESTTSTTSSPSTTQLPVRHNGSNTVEKLPLPRLSTVDSSSNLLLSSNKNQTADLQSTRTSRETQNGVQSTADKEPVNVHRTPSTTQSVGSAVAISVSVRRGDIQVARPPIDVTSTVSNIGNNTSDELSRNADLVESMFDVIDQGSVCNDQEFNRRGTENTSPPVIVIDDERSKEQRVLSVEEHSLSHSHHNQSELQLRSPKRKGIQPKKRVHQGATGTSAVIDPPIKPVPEPAEVEMDIVCSSDTLTPQSFLGTLLNTPLLQEKLAENINKVVGSSRQGPVSDEPLSDSMQSLTTTEASSDDLLTASNQGAGGDIPVKEIMDLMQADPAFDVLFSFFGLDALDALPSAANSATDLNTCTVLPETSAGSNQLEKSTSCVPSSGLPLQDALGASPIPEECQSHSGTEMTAILPTASNQQVEPPRSSSASDLHLSATSIVTDALLLLAGSPQKIPPQSQPQLDRSASVLTSGVRNPAVTPPKKKERTNSVQERSANDKQPCVNSLSSQSSLITSTFPYVRALDFSLDKVPEPAKGGARKGSKTKKGIKQRTTTDEQSKPPLTKKGARSVKRHLGASKSSSSSSNAAVSYRNVQAVSPSTIATNVNTNMSQPLANCGSAFNRSSNVISSNASPYNVVNCDTLPTSLAISVRSPAIRLSPSPSNLIKLSSVPVPSTFTCINPGSVPTSSPVTLVNSISGPINFTSAVTSQSSSPVSHTSRRSSPVLVNCSNPSTCLTLPTVNFTTSGTVHIPSHFTAGSTGSVGTLAPVDLISQHTLNAPSTVGFMNPITCPTPAPSVNLANTANSHPALPASLAISSVSSLHQVANTVISSPLTELAQAVVPGHFTNLSVVSSTTSIRNSLTTCGQEQNAGESSEAQTSASVAVVTQAPNGGVTQASDAVVTQAADAGITQATDTGVTQATDVVVMQATNAGVTQAADVNVMQATDAGVTQAAVGPFSLQASNLLQSLAVHHENTDKNEYQNVASNSDVIQFRKENSQGSQKIVPPSTPESVHGHQPLKEKSTSKKNVNLSKDNVAMSSEKHKGSISLVCLSPGANQLEKGLKDTVAVGGNLPNPLENKNGGTCTLTTMNQGCREMMKENSTGFLQSGTGSETEGQGSSNPRGKRRRDSLQKEKEKKTKSSSRPSKRSKTKAESINFPSDLNVEEFLSKLRYEVK